MEAGKSLCSYKGCSPKCVALDLDYTIWETRLVQRLGVCSIHVPMGMCLCCKTFKQGLAKYAAQHGQTLDPRQGQKGCCPLSKVTKKRGKLW